MIRFLKVYRCFATGSNPAGSRDRRDATVDGPPEPVPLYLPLARVGGKGGGGNAAVHAALQTRGRVALVQRSEVSDCDAARSEDVIDADAGGMRSNAPALATLSLIAASFIGASFIGERSAAPTAIISTRPMPNAALTAPRNWNVLSSATRNRPSRSNFHNRTTPCQG
jgi:hypothetical protein